MDELLLEDEDAPVDLPDDPAPAAVAGLLVWAVAAGGSGVLVPPTGGDNFS
jgi:hypothetical protein